MWSLTELRFDEGIKATEVYVDRGTGSELMFRDEAIAGFLAGNGPGYPADADGETDDADLAAWQAATTRFRRTGSWYGHWGTCQECGCVLLPDSADDRCHEHSTAG